MNFISRSLRILFSVYAGTYFILSFLIVIPCYFIVFNFWSKEKAPHVAHKVSRNWAFITFAFFFIRTKIKNKELIDKNQTYVFIANHRSMLDIPVYAMACSNTIRFLAKAELAKIPLLGYVIKNLYLTVARSDKSDRSKSLEAMKRALDENVSVFLCPEGTRNRTHKLLLDFHDGAFRVAIKTQKPLAVLTVVNADKLLSPYRQFELSPGTIYATWSKPISTLGMTEDDVPKLKEAARQLMIEILSKN